MCGFVGKLGEIQNKNLINIALESIKHRGPDNLDYFFSDFINIGFARLSIQDLSSISNQPISHPSRKFIMVFNGEIYNHLALRKYIKSSINSKLIEKSKSDTITLLALVDELGIEKTLSLIEGMFSIGIFYFETKKLYLIRDHFGQKPLYYSHLNGELIFASEIKALRILLDQDLIINRNCLLLPILQTHLPDSDRTIFKNIYSLEPGQMLITDENQFNKKIEYFNITSLISESSYKNHERMKLNDLTAKFSDQLNSTISKHLIADVPVGTLFSAGLDSSLIAKLCESSGNSFRIGFKTSSGEDEYFYELFDKQSNTKTNFYQNNESNEIINLPYLLFHYETINKPDGLILSSLTDFASKNKFKVLLNGDASDELFGGYPYFVDLYNQTRRLESRSVKLLSKSLNKIIPGFFKVGNYEDLVLNNHSFVPNQFDLLEPYLDIFQYKQSSLNIWNHTLEKYSFIKNKREIILMSFLLDELKRRLPRYLHRSDTYGMMNSIEMRAPYLDLELVKFAINIPIKFKINRSLMNLKSTISVKYLLKEVAKKNNVPNEIINRIKKGTPFSFHNNMIKIIKNYDLNLSSEILSIPEKRLKSSILERHYMSNFPLDILNRYAYNILCLQILAEIFVNGKSPDEISNVFRNLLLRTDR